MTQQKSNQRTPYEKKLFWRKVRMYLMWTLTFVACLIVSLTSFNARFFEAIDPQIRSAYIQMAKLMPALDANEKALVATYESLVMGRAEARKMGFTLSKEAIADSRSARDILDGSSAVDRITRLTVGRHGFVTVASKETGKILTHPNENEVGNTLMVIPFKNRDLVDIEKRTLATSVVNYKGIPDLDLNNFADEANAKNINLRRLILFSSEDGRFRLSSSPNTMLFGSIVPFGSFYIVCGISMWEYILYMSRAVFISVVACAIMWLFVHFISLTVSQHKLNGMDLRKQLTAYCLVLTVGIFCMSWYVQVLNNVTNDLNAMQIYADSGVAALTVHRERVNDHEIAPEQFRETDPALVILDAHGLRVAAVGADFLIRGRAVRAVRIAGLGREHAVELVQKLLQAPEAAACEVDGFHAEPPFEKLRVLYRRSSKVEIGYQQPFQTVRAGRRKPPGPVMQFQHALLPFRPQMPAGLTPPDAPSGTGRSRSASGCRCSTAGTCYRCSRS